MNEKERARRNLSAHAAARAARALWGNEYAAQGGGLMDFWDTLSKGRKKAAAGLATSIRNARPYTGWVATLLLALFLAGCGGDYVAEIESDTGWSGSFGSRSVNGSGNREVTLGSSSPQCAVVQKDSRGGFLRVRIRIEGGIVGIWDSTTDWVSTTAEWGVVSVCNDD